MQSKEDVHRGAQDYSDELKADTIHRKHAFIDFFT